jgi:DNA-binding MarR family transcriptional regulator
VRDTGPPAVHTALIANTGYLLSRMGAFAQRRFAEQLVPLGLTPRLWGLLNVLAAEGAITQQALGACIGIDPSSMVATIDELEAKGLVERRPHPSDRRAHALHMTQLGRETLTRGRQRAREAREELLGPLDADERQQLHDLLLRLAEAANAAPAGKPGLVAKPDLATKPAPVAKPDLVAKPDSVAKPG